MPEVLLEHSFTDILERWSAATTIGDAFSIYAGIASEFGFDQINYFDMSGYMVGAGPDRQPVSVSDKNIWTFDESWFEYYMDRGYGSYDPVFPWLYAARRPFEWGEASRSGELDQRQTTVMQEADEAGIKNGFSIPLRGPNGQLSALCVASSSRDAAVTRGFQICSLLGPHFHHISTSLEGYAEKGSPKALLTQREQEVLLWCAQGKSNWAIGEILGISEHSVKFHVQNIYKKLDANSRIAAVVKAIRMGLIQP